MSLLNALRFLLKSPFQLAVCNATDRLLDFAQKKYVNHRN